MWGFETPQEALAGAVDILVEALSEDVHLRSMTYQEVLRRSKITSQVKDESLDEKQVFQIYYDFSETVANMQGYRTLALNRGEKLGILKIGFEHAIDRILSFFAARFKVKNAYIDEVIQHLLRKVLPAIVAPYSYWTNWEGRRRSLFNCFLTICVISIL